MDFPCSECAENELASASEKHCFTCEQYFCRKCFDVHRRNPHWFDHLVASTKSLIPKSGLVQVDLSTHGVESVGGICCVTRRQRRYTIITDQSSDRILVLDESYDLSSAYQCYSKPYAVCELPSTGSVAVTMPNSKRLVVFKLSSHGKLAINQTFPTANPIRGLDVITDTFTDTLVASSGKRPRHNIPAETLIKGSINVMVVGEQNTAALLHVKQLDATTSTTDLFPQNVTFNKNKELLYFTDSSVGAIGMDVRGKIEHIFATQILAGARGVTVTSDDRLFVAGMHSNNVVEFTPDGQFVGEVVTSDHGLVCPIALFYDSCKHRLLIGCRGSRSPLKIVRL